MNVTSRAGELAPPGGSGDRVVAARTMTRILRRPEVGAAIAAVVIFMIFAVDPTSHDLWLSQAGLVGWLSQGCLIGIMAVPVGLLMIGGEFDLSAGVMTGSSAIAMGLLANQFHWNIWLCIAVSLVFAVLVGLINGMLVVKTRLPSFIVTLATFFVLRGTSVGLVEALNMNSTVVTVLQDPGGAASAKAIFGGSIGADPPYPVAIIWWLGVTILGTLLLTKTTFGNWIYAAGGEPNAARNVGVPVGMTKILLFVGTAVGAWLVGAIEFTQGLSASSEQGVGYELYYIIAAVVGGCLLTGGYGSVVGATLGAAIIGMSLQGVIYAGWPSQWGFAFLGVLLLLGVIVNAITYRQAQRARR